MKELEKLYQKMNDDKELASQYASIGKKGYGCMFAPLINANYRAILEPWQGNQYGFGGFAQGFNVLAGAEKKAGSQQTGPEKEKHHIAHMRKAFFFQVKDGAYHKTERGEVFERVLRDGSLSPVEKRLLCYLLILAADFGEIKKFLFVRTQAVFDALAAQGIPQEVVLSSIKEVVAWGHTVTRKTPQEDVFAFDFVYYDSFFVNEMGFLPLFVASSASDRAAFKASIAENIDTHILSKKYGDGGSCSHKTLIENAWLLYVTHALLHMDKSPSFDDFVRAVLQAYGALFEIDEDKLRTFIFEQNGNSDALQRIYRELFDIPA